MTVIISHNTRIFCTIDSYGHKTWKNKEGKIHRDNDLPAIILADGNQHWYKEGKCHRDNDQPAVIHPDGTQLWYKEGKCHRDHDLPVIIYADGSKEWRKNNKKYLPSRKTSTKKSKY